MVYSGCVSHAVDSNCCRANMADIRQPRPAYAGCGKNQLLSSELPHLLLRVYSGCVQCTCGVWEEPAALS